MLKFKALLVAGSALATVLATANNAEAAYAFASNRLTDVRFTFYNPSTFQLTPIPGAIGSIAVIDSANFSIGTTVFPGSTNSASTSLPTAANPTPKVLGIPQAASGPSIPFFPPPSPFPAPIDFTPYLSNPTIIGARSDAVIGAGTAVAGGTQTANVAEVNAGTGAAQSGNSSTIAFSLTSAATVALSFKNLVHLIVDTIIPGDSATATISNTFSISRCANATGNCGAQTQVFNGASWLTDINQTFTSFGGGSDGLGPITFDYTGANAIFTTLSAGQYRVSLQSQAFADVITAVPTPASLALLGFGLAGLLVVRGARSKVG